MKKPDIIEIIEREGFTLNRNKMKCPFHDENTASFIVFPQKQTFHCFGCGEGGDVIAFIQKLHNLDFKAAIRHLRVETPRRCLRDIERQQAITEFRQWETDYYEELCIQYRCIQRHKLIVQDMDNISEAAYHAESGIANRMHIMMYGDSNVKLALWREAQVE